MSGVGSRTLAASEVDKLYEDEKPTAPPEPDVMRPNNCSIQFIKVAATGGACYFAEPQMENLPPPINGKHSQKKWIDIKEPLILRLH